MNNSKRDFIRKAGLLGTAGIAATLPTLAGVSQINVGAKSSSVFNVKDFGAKGDGKTSDSAAIQKALDAAGKIQGTAYFPSGIYKCHDLNVSPNTTILAEPQFSYNNSDAGAVLTIDSEEADCLLNITGANGCHIRGIFLKGNRSASKIQHGIFFNQEKYTRENMPVIDDVRVNQFSGNGIYLVNIWVFIIRHCIIISNGGHGISIRGWDGFVTDNQLSGNGKCGFITEPYGPTVMFTANRVEWNREYGLYLNDCDAWNVTGNCFDRNFGAAIYANKVSNATFTGNVFRRNGKNPPANVLEGAEESCQMVIQSCRGITVTGNAGAVGQDDFGRGDFSPNYAFWLKDNSCSVITANAFSYFKNLVLDKGGNSTDFLVNNNAGSLFEKPNE